MLVGFVGLLPLMSDVYKNANRTLTHITAKVISSKEAFHLSKGADLELKLSKMGEALTLVCIVKRSLPAFTGKFLPT